MEFDFKFFSIKLCDQFRSKCGSDLRSTYSDLNYVCFHFSCLIRFSLWLFQHQIIWPFYKAFYNTFQKLFLGNLKVQFVDSMLF